MVSSLLSNDTSLTDTTQRQKMGFVERLPLTALQSTTASPASEENRNRAAELRFYKNTPTKKNRPLERGRFGVPRQKAGRGSLLGGGFLALDDRTIDELDVGHGRVVAGAEAALEDTDVTARTLDVTRTQLVEQLADRFLRAGAGESQTTVGDAILLGQGDERLDDATQLLGLGQGCLDDLMLDQRHAHVLEHGLTMRAGPIQVTTTLTMTHGCDSLPNWDSSRRSRGGLVVLQASRRPVLQPHAQGKTARCQNVLDLVQGLLAEVGGLQQLHFGALDQIPDVVDVLGLQAVGAAYGQLEIVYGAQQDRIDMILFLFHFLFLVGFQVDERTQLLLQDGRAATDRLFRIQGAIGFQVDDQLVEVGALFDTRGLDAVGNTTHGAEGRIQLQAADGTRFIVGTDARVGRLVAAAASHLELHLQLGALVDVGDDVLGIDDLDIVVEGDIPCGHDGRALLVQREHRLVAAVHLDRHVLEVQEDLDDIFLDAFDRAVLVIDAADLGFHHGTAGHGREQDTTQCVAQGVAEATLEGLEHDLRVMCADLFDLDVARTKKLGH